MPVQIPSWMWIVTLAVALFGAVLLIWSLRGERSHGRRRCPRCWYSMQGVPGLRCPECGCISKRERDLLRPRRRWRIAMLALVVLFASPSLIAYRQFRERGWYWLLPKYKFASETHIAGWHITLLTHRDPNDFGQAIRIQRPGNPTFMREGFHIEIGDVSPFENRKPRAGVGDDLNGDGVPDLVVSDFSGGAHCCTTYWFLSLGPDAVVEWQTIDTQNSGAHFSDLDGDGRPEIVTADNTFVYWNGPYAGSPMPRMILRCADGQYQFASDLMRAAAPSAELIDRRARDVRDDPDWAERRQRDPTALPSSAMWEEMLDLIYSGHADLAWQFLRDAWPDDRPGRDMFLADFIAQLSRSEYWEAVRAMNLPSEAPDQAGPK